MKPRLVMLIAFPAISAIMLAAWIGSLSSLRTTGHALPTAAQHSVLTSGPLRAHSTNPRYFTDASGKAIYLTGSHNAPNLMDWGPTDPPPTFDFNAHLDWLQEHSHNFIRLWRWTEAPKFKYKASDPFEYCGPHPWVRTGSGSALDGKPKFDLTKFNQRYFDRLRRRAIEAGERGIYVSIMLFEGNAAEMAKDFWFSHPFNVNNNVNGIDADPDGDGKGLEFYTLQIPAVTALQEAYVKKIIDTVNDLDNVLYEICNECHCDSTEWQYHLIDLIHESEAGKSKRHPVGMTFQRDMPRANTTLFNSPADWISPAQAEGADYIKNPPVADGKKVIILDTDHIAPLGANITAGWVWKSFLRGHNPIFIDLIDRTDPRISHEGRWNAPEVRKNLGYALTYAGRIDLARMVPYTDLSSTRYCLANPGWEYLVLLPAEFLERSFTVDLSGASGRFSAEWFNPATGKIVSAGTTTGGGMRSFRAPFSGDVVLYIRK